MHTTVVKPRIFKVVEKYENPPPSGKSLHETLKYLLLVAEILGRVPLSGVFSPDPKDVQFSWNNWRFAYCLLNGLGTLFILLVVAIKMVKYGTDLYIIGNATFLFYFCSLASIITFVQLSRNWSTLIKHWTHVEHAMRSYGSPNRLELRINIIIVVTIVCSTVEYGLNLINNILIANVCKRENQQTIDYFYEVITFPFVYKVVGFSTWSSIILHFIDFLAAVSWSYIDVFIMALSCALALRFEQITQKMRHVSETKLTDEMIWKILRDDYNRLCRLCKAVDDAISYIILLSFGGNLFFILIQLFNSLRLLKSSLNKVHFFFSFAFLIIRTVYVSLYAAWVNDESKKPITILNSVPSSIYNLEIRRFIQQISFDSVALTGSNFFSITRGLILNIAGAIVTYELVLIQFNESLLQSDSNNNSTMCA